MIIVVILHREPVDDAAKQVADMNVALFEEYSEWDDCPPESLPPTVKSRINEQLNQMLIPLVWESEDAVDESLHALAKYIAHQLERIRIPSRTLKSILIKDDCIELHLEKNHG